MEHMIFECRIEDLILIVKAISYTAYSGRKKSFSGNERLSSIAITCDSNEKKVFFNSTDSTIASQAYLDLSKVDTFEQVQSGFCYVNAKAFAEALKPLTSLFKRNERVWQYAKVSQDEEGLTIETSKNKATLKTLTGDIIFNNEWFERTKSQKGYKVLVSLSPSKLQNIVDQANEEGANSITFYEVNQERQGVIMSPLLYKIRDEREDEAIEGIICPMRLWRE